jgi:aspartyl aminopeptidase
MSSETSAASVEALLRFLDASPSPYHAVDSAKALLDAAGFYELTERDAWSPEAIAGPGGSGRRYVIRGGALIAWVAKNADPLEHGVTIVGAHTDSPNLRIKPNPDAANAGWRQWGVEVYGGTLNNSWLDRDLGLSGRVILRDGSTRLVKIDEPLARVAQLAIHLDRDVNEKGVVLDKQLHLTPIVGLGAKSSFREFLGARGNCDADEIATWDLMLHDLTPARRIGVDGEFIASGRIDNLFSAWAAIRALIDASIDSKTATPMAAQTITHTITQGKIIMAALFDHEEVGSASTTGAAGPLLETTLYRLLEAHGIHTADDRARVFAASRCVSADMAHAVHPNYADRHEPDHRPLPNAGPVVKVNANQRYATDAQTAAGFQAAARRAEVDCQTFVSRNSQPCGSTIGPITATQLGIPTVDVGCAMLSMHSARELCGAQDAELFRRVLVSYFQL